MLVIQVVELMKARSARLRDQVELARLLSELSAGRCRFHSVGLPLGSHSRDL